MHVPFPRSGNVCIVIARPVDVIPFVWLCYDQQALGVYFHLSYGACSEVSAAFTVRVLIGIRDTAYSVKAALPLQNP